MSVNISSEGLREALCTVGVRDTLAETGLDPRRRQLEMTERVRP